MSHSVKIYDTCIGCTQCVRACPTDVLEMVPGTAAEPSRLPPPRAQKTVWAASVKLPAPPTFASGLPGA